MPLPLYLALAHVRRRLLQTVLTIAGVAVGVGVLILALSLTNGFIDELLSSTLRATPHVTLRTYASGGRMPQDAGAQARIAEHPGVVAVAPFLAVEALIARRADASLGVSGRQGYTQLLGIDPAREVEVLSLPALQDAATTLEARDGVLLGGTLALQLGVLEGDSVMIQDIRGHRRQLEVLGSFRVGNELIDGVASYASLQAVQDYLNAENEISGYHVRITDPEQAESVGLALADATGLRSTAWSSVFGGLVSQLRLQKAVISVVVFLIVLVAAMGIANVLVLTVSEKTAEIAVLRAMGASQAQVLATFALEGAILGGAGTLLGTALGVAASTYFRLQPFPLPGDLYFITQLPVQVQAFDVAWVCALSLTTSALAGLLPARRAAGLDPSSVLR
ncbi:MAG: ABC transporter permease [Trueperaceae bacterium]|nr:ABC transporter permease [Trueperaceae bacterium]